MALLITDNMKAFLKVVESDAVLKERFRKAHTIEEVSALAEEKGFSITENDLRITSAPVSKLSDDALENVSGGIFAEFDLSGLLTHYMGLTVQ